MADFNWSDIETLFEAALDQPAESRIKWLRSVCTDQDTYREVASMLRAADLAEGFLSRSASEVASTLIVESQSDRPSSSPVESWLPASGEIGRYRVVKRIGWGGAGAVYLAERADGEFEQRVAIKLLREDKITRVQRRRFLSERQILASLDHPGIARLLDGGVTDDGMPFIVMEFVDGWPIDQYCDERNLSLRSRLKLFQQVCVAVQHAHSRLVVHRDIKPSNVMITSDGRVKLIDFGIAKLIDSELDDADSARPTMRLTPEYASPEQVNGEPVTAVSDVYSLGVLLYQILSGHRPYDVGGHSPAAIIRTVCDHDPPPPSTRVREQLSADREHQAPSPEENARRRNASVETLERALRGDLDTIIMKALRKEPGRRYQSVESFSDDLGRYLNTRPVAARGDSLLYRVSKYVRRNRIIVTAVVLVTLALLAGLATSLWQSAQRAEQAERAERTTSFMRDMLAGFNPNARPEGLEHVEEILDRGADRLHRDLAGEPKMSAEIASVLGDLYYDYGLYQKARDLFELSIAQRRVVSGDDDAGVADNTLKLAQVVNKMGEHDEARALMLNALDLIRSVYGVRSSRFADALDGLAVVELNVGQFDESERLFNEALDILRLHHGEENVRVAVLHRHLAYVNQQKYRLETADSLYGIARDAMARALGHDHTEVAQTIHDHGSLLARMGKLPEAEDNFTRALVIRRQRLGDYHPQVAQSLSHLGLLLSRAGRYDEAERMLEEALSIRRRAFGENHLTFAHTVNQLGQLNYARGDHEASDSLLLAAITMYRELLGEKNIQTAAALQIRGRRLVERGLLTDAAEIFREVLQTRRELLGENTLPTTESMMHLGTTLLALGDAHEASMLLQESTQIRHRLFGERHERTIEAQLGYGRSLTALGRYAEAESTLTSILGALSADNSLSGDLQDRIRTAVAELYKTWPAGS